ncbi:MAG: hypothetical protein IPG07_14575 [Crocinitomicaceae bacterium]|nr:hypothetical protein [Crocinitomicaceae bacterium]
MDTDSDGLTDGAEISFGTNPANPDSDGDGLQDGEEVNTYLTNPLLTDTDGGGAGDGMEILASTDPNNNADDAFAADADADGMPLSVELSYGLDDNDCDFDDDGLMDGHEQYVTFTYRDNSIQTMI